MSSPYFQLYCGIYCMSDVKVRGAAAPKEPMTYAFTHGGNFSSFFSFFFFSIHPL